MHSYRLLLILVVGVGTIGCDSPTEPAEKASGQVVRPGRMIVDGVRERLSSITRIAVSERGLVAFDQPDDPKLGVANVQTGQIARFGRSGGGPGEYPGSPSLAWRGDTVLLTGGARIAFSSSGTYLAGENLARQLMVQDDQDSSGLVSDPGQSSGPWTQIATWPSCTFIGCHHPLWLMARLPCGVPLSLHWSVTLRACGRQNALV